MNLGTEFAISLKVNRRRVASVMWEKPRMCGWSRGDLGTQQHRHQCHDFFTTAAAITSLLLPPKLTSQRWRAIDRQQTLLLTTLVGFPSSHPQFGRSFKMPGQSEPTPRSPPLSIHPSIHPKHEAIGWWAHGCLLAGWMDGWMVVSLLLDE